MLRLTKSANKTEAAIGDIVTYKVQISNTIASDVPDVRIIDYLPPNFKYVDDSARLNGAPLANPIGNRPLIFNIGTVPGLVDGNGNGRADPGEPGYLVVKYQLVIGSGAQPGDYENTAFAASGCNTCQITTIIGKVFLDKTVMAGRIRVKPVQPVPWWPWMTALTPLPMNTGAITFQA